MFRHVVPLLMLVVIFLGGFFLIANTPWLANRYGAAWLTQQVQGLEVESLSVNQQRYRWPDQLNLTGLKGKVRYLGKDYQLTADRISIKGTFKSFQEKEPLRFLVKGGGIKSEDMDIENIRLQFVFPREALQKKVLEGKGMLETAKFRFRRYELDSTAVRFGITPDQFQVFEASANLYGGNFQSGQVSFQFQPGALYISWSELTGLDAGRLARVNAEIFSGLFGKINGTWRLVGDAGKVEVLAVIFSMPEGGTMSPDLIKRFVNGIRDTATQEKLRQIISQNQLWTFDSATLHIQNIDFQTVALVIGIEKKAQDLHVQERILVPLKTGLRDFLLNKTE